MVGAQGEGRTEEPVRRSFLLLHGDRRDGTRRLQHPGIDAVGAPADWGPVRLGRAYMYMTCRWHGLPCNPARGEWRISCSGTCAGKHDLCRSGVRAARDLRLVRTVLPRARPGTGHAGRIAVRPDHVGMRDPAACCRGQRSGATFMTLDI